MLRLGFNIASAAGRLQGADITLPTPPGVMDLITTSGTVDEGADFTLSVTRTGGSSGAASVLWAVSGGLTTPASGSLSWADGEEGIKSVTVTANAVTGDTSDDITLGVPAGATLGVASGTLNVINIVAPSISAQPSGTTQLTGTSHDLTVATSGVVTGLQWYRQFPGDISNGAVAEIPGADRNWRVIRMDEFFEATPGDVGRYAPITPAIEAYARAAIQTMVANAPGVTRFMPNLEGPSTDTGAVTTSGIHLWSLQFYQDEAIALRKAFFEWCYDEFPGLTFIQYSAPYGYSDNAEYIDDQFPLATGLKEAGISEVSIERYYRDNPNWDIFSVGFPFWQDGVDFKARSARMFYPGMKVWLMTSDVIPEGIDIDGAEMRQLVDYIGSKGLDAVYWTGNSRLASEIPEDVRAVWRDDPVAIPGATSATYSITGAEELDSARYFCRVSYADGVIDSNTVLCRFAPAPVITTNIASSLNIDEGNDIRLACFADNAEIVWDLNTGSGWVEQTGIDSAIYDLGAAAASMEGDQIRARAVSVFGLGEVTSTTLTLSINPFPGVLNLVTTSTTVDEGDEFLLTVERVNGTGGEAGCYYNVNGGLATPSFGLLEWADGEGGNKSVTLTAAAVTSNQATDIIIGVPAGAALGVAAGTLNVTNVPAGGNITLVTTAISENEGDPVVITAVRVNDSEGAASVDWAIADAALVDETANGTFNWADGESGNKSVTLTASLVSSTQNSTVALTNISGATFENSMAGTIRVLDIPAPSTSYTAANALATVPVSITTPTVATLPTTTGTVSVTDQAELISAVAGSGDLITVAAGTYFTGTESLSITGTDLDIVLEDGVDIDARFLIASSARRVRVRNADGAPRTATVGYIWIGSEEGNSRSEDITIDGINQRHLPGVIGYNMEMRINCLRLVIINCDLRYAGWIKMRSTQSGNRNEDVIIANNYLYDGNENYANLLDGQNTDIGSATRLEGFRRLVFVDNRLENSINPGVASKHTLRIHGGGGGWETNNGYFARNYFIGPGNMMTHPGYSGTGQINNIWMEENKFYTYNGFLNTLLINDPGNTPSSATNVTLLNNKVRTTASAFPREGDTGTDGTWSIVGTDEDTGLNDSQVLAELATDEWTFDTWQAAGAGYTVANATVGLPFSITTPTAPVTSGPVETVGNNTQLDNLLSAGINGKSVRLVPDNASAFSGTRIFPVMTDVQFTFVGDATFDSIVLPPGSARLEFEGETPRLASVGYLRLGSSAGLSNSVGSFTGPVDDVVFKNLYQRHVKIASGAGYQDGNSNKIYGRRLAFLGMHMEAAGFTWQSYVTTASGRYLNDVIIANCYIHKLGLGVPGSDAADYASTTEPGFRTQGATNIVYVDNRFRMEVGPNTHKHILRIHSNTNDAADNQYVGRNQFEMYSDTISIQNEASGSSVIDADRIWFVDNDLYQFDRSQLINVGGAGAGATTWPYRFVVQRNRAWKANSDSVSFPSESGPNALGAPWSWSIPTAGADQNIATGHLSSGDMPNPAAWDYQ